MARAAPTVDEAGTQVVHLPLNVIQRNAVQPRQRFDAAGLSELSASLREHGLLQPVLVRPLDDGRFELIAGERRWLAAHQAGLTTVPAIVLHASTRRSLELALVENLQRTDLTPLEEAAAYRALMTELGLTQERLAERLGISRVAVTNRLRLLNLSPAARQALLDGRITEGHARALLALDRDEQDGVVATVVAGGLSVRQTECLVRRRARGDRARRGGDTDYTAEALEESLRRALGAQVRVRRAADGVLVRIHFHALEAACRMAEALMPDGAMDDP